MNPNRKEPSMPFVALEVAVDLIHALQGPLARIRQQSRTLAEQIDSASESAALNLGEGRRRGGRDRLQLFRIASGSAAEVMTGLRIAEARGLDAEQLAPAKRLCDRLLALTWGLTR
jgi:four helix bundle protein